MDDRECDRYSYGDVDKSRIDEIISALEQDGCTVIGSNPWDIDTVKHGVKLQGQWDETTQALCVIVTDKEWYVPYSRIWKHIDPLIHPV